jgi:hypothetical protein
MCTLVPPGSTGQGTGTLDELWSRNLLVGGDSHQGVRTLLLIGGNMATRLILAIYEGTTRSEA